MTASRILSTLIAFLLLSGCSNLKDSMGLDFEVTSIQVVESTPTDEWSESDEVIDRIEEQSSESARLGAQGLLSWTPDATRGRETKSTCRLLKLREILRSTPTASAREYGERINSYFEQCERELAQGSGIGLLRDLKMTRLRYEVAQSRHIQEIVVNFSNGYRVRGMLALKPDSKKRPLIIARCGVFCDVTDRYPRSLLMHLFDESPFNVLILASTTGETFALDNKEFGIGGYLEATQHMRLAEYLLAGGFGIAERISSIHNFGGSLGGNAAAFTALLADKNRDLNGHRIIQSSWAHCPVVNLQDTLEEVLRPNIKGFFMSLGANRVLKNVYSGRGWDFGGFRGPSSILKIIKEEAHTNYSRYFSSPLERYSPMISDEFSSIEDVWKANQFSNYAASVQTPLVAFAAADDWIVHTDINTETLFPRLAVTSDHNVSAIKQPEGRHCAQSLVYGWSTMSEIFRTYFILQSPDFYASEKQIQFELESSALPIKLLRLTSREYHYSQKWKLKKNEHSFELEFKIWSPSGKSRCDTPLDSGESCFRTVEIDIPLKVFESESFVTTPESDAEAQALTRWANSNVTVHTLDGSELEHTTEKPTYLKWLTYD